MTKPITGIRVLDFGILLAGPRGARLLGEFGAEVIQVENLKRATHSEEQQKTMKQVIR